MTDYTYTIEESNLEITESFSLVYGDTLTINCTYNSSFGYAIGIKGNDYSIRNISYEFNQYRSGISNIYKATFDGTDIRRDGNVSLIKASSNGSTTYTGSGRINISWAEPNTTPISISNISSSGADGTVTIIDTVSGESIDCSSSFQYVKLIVGHEYLFEQSPKPGYDIEKWQYYNENPQRWVDVSSSYFTYTVQSASLGFEVKCIFKSLPVIITGDNRSTRQGVVLTMTYDDTSHSIQYGSTYDIGPLTTDKTISFTLSSIPAHYQFDTYQINYDSGNTEVYTANPSNIQITIAKGSGTVVASITGILYTASFNSAGGQSVSDIQKRYGTGNITLPSCIRAGYTFNGWVYNGTTYQAGASFLLDANITFAASWTANTYTISMDANGGELPQGTTNPISVTYDSPISGLVTPARNGYTFSGWYCNGIQLSNGVVYVITSNITVTASWEVDLTAYTCNVTYVYYDNTGTEQHQTYTNQNYIYTVQTVGGISVWQMYQSSDYVTAGNIVKLPRTGTIFYSIQTPTNTGQMRAVISRPGCELDLGDIQSITDTFSSTVNSIPVLPYGYGKGFAIDVGVQRTIQIAFKRVSPIPCNDYGQGNNSTTWSNKKWIEEYKRFTDRWQMETNGCRLYLMQPKDQNGNALMPDMYTYIEDTMGLNCYISSAPISYQSGFHDAINESITLRVGTIYPRPESIPMTTIHLKKADADETALVPSTMNYPSDSCAQLPYVHLSSSTEYLQYWCKKVNGQYIPINDGIIPPVSSLPRDPFYIGQSDMTIYAMVNDLTGGTLITSNESSYHVSTDGDYMIYCVGGGGGGGAAARIYLPYTIHIHGGGGGASGYYSQTIVSLTTSDVLNITIGNGGSQGNTGGSTSVKKNNSPLLSAAGGSAGGVGGSQSGGSGGSSGYMTGGNGGIIREKGSDGSHNDTYIHSRGGSAISGTRLSTLYVSGGGGGGGQPPIMPGVSASAAYGGDGVGGSEYTKNGALGGGGGGGSIDSSSYTTLQTAGSGGNGYVYIVKVN